MAVALSGSLELSGSLIISGSIVATGPITVSGSIASASFAITAATASSADNFLVRNTLTAQTLVVQTITSSVDFVTGSTQFGSLSANTHVFTGSVLISSGSVLNVGRTDNGYPFAVASQFAKTDTTGRGLIFLGSNEAYASNPFGLVITVTGASTLANRYVQVNTTDFGSANGGNLIFQGSGGNVGIGTTNPTAKLSVSGTIESLTDSAGEGGQITLRGNTFQYGIDNFNGTGLRFIRENDGTGASGIVQMFISSSGNIGIGTTSPSYKLDVSGGGRFNSGATAQNVIISSTNAGSTATTLQISNSSNTAYNDGVKMVQGGGTLRFHDLNDTALLGFDLSNTRVGVLTTAPLTPLDVKQSSTGAATANAAFRDSSTNGNALQIWNGNNESRFRAVYYGTPSDQNITFYTITSAGSEAERIRITSGGVLRFSSVPFNNYQLDTSTPITVANGGTISFETFSGLILINNMSNGNVGMWMVGAGNTVLVSQVYGAAVGTMAYSGAINGYVWTSNSGATSNYGVFAVRTRANA